MSDLSDEFEQANAIAKKLASELTVIAPGAPVHVLCLATSILDVMTMRMGAASLSREEYLQAAGATYDVTAGMWARGAAETNLCPCCGRVALWFHAYPPPSCDTVCRCSRDGGAQ